MISERKLDSSFLARRAHINGFSETYTFNRNSNGGGIRDDITSKLILKNTTIEKIFVEINLRKKIGLFAAQIKKNASKN